MPLTRHLYELDEVIAAAQLCLRRRWTRALFWIWELVVSGEPALDLLRATWLDHGAPVDPTLLQVQPMSPADWVALTYRVMDAIAANPIGTHTVLTTLPTSRPGVTPLPRTSAIATRRRTRSAAFVATTTELDPEEAARWWISLDAAMRQGARADATWLLQAVQPILSPDTIWTALSIASRAGADPVIAALRAAATPHPLSQLQFQTAATLYLCMRSKDRSPKAALPPLFPASVNHGVESWTEWTAVIGRRQARIHAIPVEALHSGTTRGQMSRRFTNINEIREPIPGLGEGCAWWQSALAAAGIEQDPETDALAFPDDATMESFYDAHFPDDIPDEWSAADQQKSHGRGVEETAPPAPAPILVCEEPVSTRAWNLATHVRAAKKLTGVTARFAQLQV
jgi:hypothetical protein